jgi:hypothetical protein
MTSAQRLLLFVQATMSFVVLGYLGYHLFRARQENHKYKLYALRDKLLYLMATGQVKEDSLLFKVFYTTVVGSIKEIKDLKLWNIAKASVAARSVMQEQQRERLGAEIKAASPEVKEFVMDFYHAMMDIAVANSPLLVLFIRLANHQAVSRAGRYIKRFKIFLNEQQQYEAYRYFEDRGGFAT